MWKYIVIASLVLFAAASFLFYKTHNSLVSSGGEVEALQAQYETAIAKNKEIFVDEGIAAYAKMRYDWLEQRRVEADAQKAKLEEEDVTYQGEIERLTKEWESLGGAIEEQKAKLQEDLRALGNSELLKSALDKARELGNKEVQDVDASDPDVLQNISANIRVLQESKKEVEQEIAKESAVVQSLEAQRVVLTDEIAAADALAKERRARISPADLECHVINADPSWDYAILDAGIDKGIIIGSRLAVMRDGKKICELNVTLVEANRSSCDVVYNTLLTGETVHPGDRVIAVRHSSQEN